MYDGILGGLGGGGGPAAAGVGAAGAGRAPVLGSRGIVAGPAGLGTPAACELAARGKRVLGLEQHAPGHDRGSSHGGSRLIRQAYFEDPAYVPLVRRAYELWRRLEAETNRDLMTLCGGLMLGHRGSEVLEGSLRSARGHGLPRGGPGRRAGARPRGGAGGAAGGGGGGRGGRAVRGAAAGARARRWAGRRGAGGAGC